MNFVCLLPGGSTCAGHAAAACLHDHVTHGRRDRAQGKRRTGTSLRLRCFRFATILFNLIPMQRRERTTPGSLDQASYRARVAAAASAAAEVRTLASSCRYSTVLDLHACASDLFHVGSFYAIAEHMLTFARACVTVCRIRSCRPNASTVRAAHRRGAHVAGPARPACASGSSSAPHWQPEPRRRTMASLCHCPASHDHNSIATALRLS